MANFSLQEVLRKQQGKKHGSTKFLPAIAGILVWVSVGTFVYWAVQNCTTQDIDYSPCPAEQPTETCGWTFAQSFYYSIQTGLSIGFGLLAEDKDLSRIYSVLHILAGSSVIAGALALFATISLEGGSAWQTDQEKKLARFAASMHENGYKGLKSEEMVELCLLYPVYLRDLYMKMEKDNAEVVAKMQVFENSSERKKKIIVMDAMEQAHEKVEEFKDGLMSIDELRALHQENRATHRRCLNWAKNHRNTIKIYGIFALWVLIGIIYGVAVEKWSFIQSLYFSISTLSTAGLQAVTPCNGGANVVFAGVYSLIGVPIFGMALGTFANLLVENYNKAKFNENTTSRITRAEVEFVEHLADKEHSDSVDLNEYMQIQLLRLGKVDRGDLESIKAQFDKLNPTSGRIMKDLFLPNFGRVSDMLKQKSGGQASKEAASIKVPDGEPPAADKTDDKADPTQVTL